MKTFITLAAATLVGGGSILFAADQASDPAADRPAASGDRTPAAQPAAARDTAGERDTAGARDAAGSSARSENPDQMFIKDAISDNLLEVQLGQIAQDKATDADVKQFAAQLVKDHTQSLQKLRQLAKSSNIETQDQLKPVHQAKLQEMQKLPADAFTRKYVVGQYGHHVMDVLEFSWQAQNAQNASIKQFASDTLPILRRHQEHAQQIAMTIVGAAGTDAARPAGARVPKTGAGKTGASDAQDNTDRPAEKGTSDRPSDRDKPGASATDNAPAGNGRAQ
jgi:putative membrane protein